MEYFGYYDPATHESTFQLNPKFPQETSVCKDCLDYDECSRYECMNVFSVENCDGYYDENIDVRFDDGE